MKILLISPYIPYPPITGGKVRVLNFLKNLQKKHQIILLCLLKTKSEEKDVQEISRYCYKVIPVLRRKAWSVPNLLRTALSRYSFLTVVNNFSTETEEAIKKVLKEEKPDLVHLETFYMAQSVLAVKDFIKVPLMLAKVDVEAQVYFRNAAVKNFLNPFKYLGYFDAWKMLNYEIEVCRHFDKIACASKIDADLLAKYLPQNISQRIEIVPNGVDCAHFDRERIKDNAKDTDPSIILSASFRYFANTDAAFFFTQRIWPRIIKEIPNTKLYLMGPELPPGIQRSISGSIRQLESESIIITGFVSEEEKLRRLAKAWVSVAPLRIGSGTKLKVLEAMSMELPVVATSVGIEGIEAENGRETFIADKPEDFAQKIITLIKNGNLRQKMGQAGRKLMKEKYDWQVITSHLGTIYQNLIHEKP